MASGKLVLQKNDSNQSLAVSWWQDEKLPSQPAQARNWNILTSHFEAIVVTLDVKKVRNVAGAGTFEDLKGNSR